MSEITNNAPTVGPNATFPANTTDTSARAAEDGRLADRILPQFHYPVPREHTGKLQYRIDRGEVVTIDRIGDVRRGGVIAVKNVNFARGLIAGQAFANAPADAPLGQPEKYAAKPKEQPVTEAVNLTDRLPASAPTAPVERLSGTAPTLATNIDSDNLARAKAADERLNPAPADTKPPTK